MSELTKKHCVPCEGGVPALKEEEIVVLKEELHEDWKVIDNHHLERAYTFKDFKEALVFVNLVGGLAEQEGHHPDLFLAWGRAKITLFTHKIDGLTESDFILAAKIDLLYR